MMSARGRKVVDPRLWFLALLTWWCLWPLRATSRMWGRKRGSSWLLSTHSSVNLSNQIGITFVKFHKPKKWGGGGAIYTYKMVVKIFSRFLVTFNANHQHKFVSNKNSKYKTRFVLCILNYALFVSVACPLVLINFLSFKLFFLQSS